MRKPAALAILFGLILVATFSFATGQAGDILILDGKKYSIFTNPLESWVEKNPNRVPRSNVTSTALWRGYIATFTVKEHGLYLTNIEILNDDPMKSMRDMRSVMATVFPHQTDVLADWFTGNIIIPEGKEVQYVHMGYASTYEKYIILRVERGVVQRQSNLDTREFVEFREKQFERFKKTEQYRKALEETKKESEKDGPSDPKQDEQFLKEFYSAEYMAMIFPEESQKN